jgi:hypothetical protein
MSQHYTHSGKFPPSGLLVGVAVSSAIAAVLSPVYALALFYIPFVYINCFVAFGYGLAVGFATGYGLRLGKVRSIRVTVLAALGVGILATYAGWVSWFLVAAHRLLFRPSELLAALGSLAATGSWSIGQSKPTGVFLCLIWGAELVAISLLAAFAAHMYLEEHVFCERCDGWLPDSKKIGPLEPLTPDQMARVTPELLQSLRPIPAASPLATNLEVWSCPTCHLLNVVTVKLATTATDKQGKVSPREHVVVRGLLVPAPLTQPMPTGGGA